MSVPSDTMRDFAWFDVRALLSIWRVLPSVTIILSSMVDPVMSESSMSMGVVSLTIKYLASVVAKGELSMVKEPVLVRINSPVAVEVVNPESVI